MFLFDMTTKKAVFHRLFLFHYRHLVDQMSRSSELIDDKQHVSNVDADVPTDVGVIDKVAHRTLPTAVEIKA